MYIHTYLHTQLEVINLKKADIHTRPLETINLKKSREYVGGVGGRRGKGEKDVVIF